MATQTRIDLGSDVLYVLLEGCSVVDSRESQQDTDTILNLDSEGRVVGVQIIGAISQGVGAWLANPVRQEIPPTLLAAVDETIREYD